SGLGNVIFNNASAAGPPHHRVHRKLFKPAQGLPALEIAASKIEGFGLFLRSVAASEEVLLRAMAPSLDEENFDDVYDVKRYIKLGDDRRVMVLGWPEFDVNNKECAIESTRA
ncbi:unnamed protein product, partial [Ascophyllum nodosum]